MYYGGSDLGEMIVTSDKIRVGDPESWFTEWDKVGRKILANADASLEAGHHESARSAYLRASTYLRMAEFYLHGNPSDPRILSEAKDSVKAMPPPPALPVPPGNPSRSRMKEPPCPATSTRWATPAHRVRR